MKKNGILIGLLCCFSLLACMVLFLIWDKTGEEDNTDKKEKLSWESSEQEQGSSSGSGNSSENSISESAPVPADYSNMNILLAVDNTRSMKGYAKDQNYINLLKILEKNLSDYQKKITVLAPASEANSKKYLKWQDYDYDKNGNVSSNAIDSNSSFYCKGEYENVHKGPIHLLFDDEKEVGAFAANTVNVLVTDFHEQGGSLHTLGEDIRKKCVENLGDASEYAAAILAFDFAFGGEAYIIDPENPTNSIETIMDAEKDTKPLYVVIAGQADGVKHYCELVVQCLADEKIVHDQIDNLESLGESDSVLGLVPERKAVQQDFSNAENREQVLAIAREYLVGLKPYDPAGSKYPESTLLYDMDPNSVSVPGSANLFEGFANWICRFELKDTGSALTTYAVQDISYEVFLEDESQEGWKLLTEESWKGKTPPFEIVAEEDFLSVTMCGKALGTDEDRMYLNNCNIKMIFRVNCALQRLDSSLEWIERYDLHNYSKIPKNEWPTRTLDLGDFCRGLLGIRTAELMREYENPLHQETFEVVFMEMKNF